MTEKSIKEFEGYAERVEATTLRVLELSQELSSVTEMVGVMCTLWKEAISMACGDVLVLRCPHGDVDQVGQKLSKVFHGRTEMLDLNVVVVPDNAQVLKMASDPDRRFMVVSSSNKGAMRWAINQSGAKGSLIFAELFRHKQAMDAMNEGDEIVEVNSPAFWEMLTEEETAEWKRDLALFAARAKAVEEAAELCEGLLKHGCAPSECARQIRGLIDGQKEKKGEDRD